MINGLKFQEPTAFYAPTLKISGYLFYQVDLVLLGHLV